MIGSHRAAARGEKQMKIGIISDSHDHVWNLRIALRALRPEVDLLIHCGDLCSPFIVPIIASGFDGPVHSVFGNNDADRYRLQVQAGRASSFTLEGESWFPELGGMRIAVQHFDSLARPLAESGRFDLVCFGHNHRFEIDRVGSTWLVNPGAILGYDPVAGSDVDPTFVVFDTERRMSPTIWSIEAGTARPMA
jgi:putative phosphoesterase